MTGGGPGAPGDRRPSLTGRTVLFAQPSAELYGSDRVLLESVEAVVQGGGRAVVTLPLGGPLEVLLETAGAEVVICVTPVLKKSSLRPAGLVLLLTSAVRGLVAGLALLKRVRPDAVYVNTVTVPLWIILGRLVRVPVLAHVHEAEGSVSRPTAALLGLPLRFATRVIANSRYSVSVLARTHPALARRMSVVYNGVPGPAGPAPARAVIDGGLRVLFVGRLSARKGAEIAVGALAALQARGVDASLRLVGAAVPGQEEYRDALVDHIKRAGLDERVHLLGFQDDIWPHLAWADVAVVPSLGDEPFGNTAVEALLACRPVIVSDTSGLREAAGGYRSSRAVTPGDPAALADALVEVAATWESTRTDAVADSGTAWLKHSPERYRNAIAAILADLLPPVAAHERQALPAPAPAPFAPLTTNEV